MLLTYILVCHIPLSPMFSTCSSSEPDFHFHQWYISAYDYIIGEANMTNIFAVYLQVSAFRSQSSEYCYECCHKLFGRYCISLSYSTPGVDLIAFFVPVDCPRAVGVDFLREFDVHIFCHLFLMRGQSCLSLH